MRWPVLGFTLKYGHNGISILYRIQYFYRIYTGLCGRFWLIFPSFPTFVLTAKSRGHIIVLRMPTSTWTELPYLRTAEVAGILRVTKRTLKNWLRRGSIPEPQRNPSNRYRLWTLEDVEAVRRFLTERNGAK